MAKATAGTASAPAAAEPGPAAATAPARAGRRVRLRGADRGAAALVGLHLGLLGWAAFGGSFLGDDLVRSTEAARAPLDWDYLTTDVYGHLAPGYRLTFWLQNQVFPLDHDAAVVALLALQALTALLAWRLFRELFGPARALVPLVLYLFSALALPSFLWWSSAVNLVPCHLAMLAATLGHLRVLRHGSRAAAVGVAGSVAVGMLFWEKTALVLVVLPLLTLVLTGGGPAARFARLRGLWWAWLGYAAPVLGLAVPYLAGAYQSPSGGVTVTEGLDVLGVTVWEAVLPAVVGGPLDWSPVGLYFAVGTPPPWLPWLGLTVVAVLAVVCVRRRRGRSLEVLALVGVPVVLTAVLTAAGRFDAFGLTVARDYRYASDLLVPLALAVGLALWPAGPEVAGASAAGPSRHGRAGGVVLSTVCAGVVAVSVLSTVAYTRIWHRNPVGEYLAHAREAMRYTSDEAQPVLYDATVPPGLLEPVYAPYNHPSQILAPLRRQARYDDPYTPPGILDDRGRAGPARFDVATRSRPGPAGACNWFADTGAVTVPLERDLPTAYWTVKVYFLASAPTPASVLVTDGDTDDLFPTFVSPGRSDLPQGLGVLYAHTSQTTVGEVRLQDLREDLCVLKVEVGQPVAVR